MKGCIWIVLASLAPILILVAAKVPAGIALGILYWNECPMEPTLPKWIITVNTFLLVRQAVTWVLTCGEIIDNIMSNVYALVYIGLMVYGYTKLYPMFETVQSKDAELENFCARGIFVFAVGEIILTLVLLLFLFIALIFIALWIIEINNKCREMCFEIQNIAHINGSSHRIEENRRTLDYYIHIYKVFKRIPGGLLVVKLMEMKQKRLSDTARAAKVSQSVGKNSVTVVKMRPTTSMPILKTPRTGLPAHDERLTKLIIRNSGVY